MKFPLTPNIQPAIHCVHMQLLKTVRGPKANAVCSKMRLFLMEPCSWKITGLLLPSLTSSVVTDTKTVLRKSVNRRGISGCSSVHPSGPLLERCRCLQQPLELNWMGWQAQGCGMDGLRGTCRKHSAPCILPLLSSAGMLPHQLTCLSLAMLGGKAAQGALPWADRLQPGISLWSCGCGKREVSVTAHWLPSLLSSGTEPAPCLVPFSP